MGIRRTLMKFETEFTQVPNAWLRDERLSRRARGLLAELMTHRVGWRVSIASLQKAGPEGRDALRAAVLELVEVGYLRLSQGRGARGRFNEIEYELCDPFTADGKPDTGGFADIGEPDTGGSTDDGPADDGPADVGESATKKNISSEHHAAEDQGEAPSRFCARHPNGSDGVPCGPCRDARLERDDWDAKRKRAPVIPIPPREIAECAAHPGYPPRGCPRCAEDRMGGVA